MAKSVESDNVTAEGIKDSESTETIAPVPAGVDPNQMKQMISQQMAESLVPMLATLLPELLKTMAPQVNLPSAQVQGHMIDTRPESTKPNYLKHYRRDSTISGKYQLVDVGKLIDDQLPVNFVRDQNNQLITELPAVIKGKWIHFVNDEFYAQTQQEVDFIEWKMRTDPTFRVYEVTGPGTIPCPVFGCKVPAFANQETLTNHMKATHGV